MNSSGFRVGDRVRISDPRQGPREGLNGRLGFISKVDGGVVRVTFHGGRVPSDGPRVYSVSLSSKNVVHDREYSENPTSPLLPARSLDWLLREDMIVSADGQFSVAKRGREYLLFVSGNAHPVAAYRREEDAKLQAWRIAADRAENRFARNPTPRELGFGLAAAAAAGALLYIALRPAPAVAAQKGAASVPGSLPASPPGATQGKILSTQVYVQPSGGTCVPSGSNELAEIHAFAALNSLLAVRPKQPGEPLSTISDLAHMNLTSVTDPDTSKIDADTSDRTYEPSRGIYPKDRLNEAIATASSVSNGAVLSLGYRMTPCPGGFEIQSVYWIVWDKKQFAPPSGLAVA